MKPETAKVYLSGIGILSLAFFFWLFLYQMFVNTQADTNSVQMYFEQTSTQASRGETVSLNVYLQSPPSNHISTARLTIQYPPNIMRFVSTLNDSNFDPNNPADVQCMGSNPLSKEVSVADDPERGAVTVTRSVLDQRNAPSGISCFGTLRFVVRENAAASTGMISFGDTFGIPASGPQGNYVLLPSGNNAVKISITK